MSAHMPPGRNPLQGVTTALPRSLIGSNFPELDPPVSHKKRQFFSKGGDGTRMVASRPEHPSEMGGNVCKKIDAARIAKFMPQWTTLDKKALRFYGYFKEAVVEMRHETERLRKITITYFLVDDTLQVSEGKQPNSGMAQGTMVRRHKVVNPTAPKTGPNKTEPAYFGPDDLRVGSTCTIYGKTFVLCDCDAFTREFYTMAGAPQDEAIGYPGDSYAAHREHEAAMGTKDPDFKRVMELDASQRAGGTVHKLSGEERDLAKSYYENDRKVLRFKCFWEDTSVGGDTHHFYLYYYLKDGKCRLTLVKSDGTSEQFMKPTRLPKPSKTHQATNLETISEKGPRDYYDDRDFGPGQTVVVYGRELVIADMDPYTKAYYGQEVDNGVAPLEAPPSTRLNASFLSSAGTSPPKKAPERVPPPYNGFGEEEDSLGSWKYLVLKQPKRDIARELRDRDKILRFGAKLVPKFPTDAGRTFILSYFLSDNTLQIFETVGANSGLVGGKYLRRQRCKISPAGSPAEYLRPEALYVGATLELFGQTFTIHEADQRTVALMEGHPKVFTVADVNEILPKIRNALNMTFSKVKDAFRHLDTDRSGYITLDEFKAFLERQQIDISEHEIVTLMRYLDVNSAGMISYQSFCARMFADDYKSELDFSDGSDVVREIENDFQKYRQAQADAEEAGFASQVAANFLKKLFTYRSMVGDAFRTIANRSIDGCITQGDFTKCLQDQFQFSATPEEERALVRRFFLEPKTGVVRDHINFHEFIRTIEQIEGQVA